MFNLRQKTILEELLQAEDFISISYLSKKHEVTPRTIRNDLSIIEMYLLKKFSEEFLMERNHHKGVYLNQLKEKSNEIILMQIENISTPYTMPKSKLKIFILLRLLLGVEKISSQTLEKELNVTRSTIYQVLSEIEHILESHQISYKKEKSMINEIMVLHRIEVFMKLFNKHISYDEFYAFIGGSLFDTQWVIFFENLFKKSLLEFLKQRLYEIENLLGRKYDDESFIKIMIYLYMIILGQDENKIQEALKQKYTGTKEYQISRTILVDLSESGFRIEPTEVLISGLAYQLLIGRTIHKNEEQFLYQKLAEELIDKVEKNLNIVIENREVLINSLQLHLHPMFYRLAEHKIIENPMLIQIMQKYKDIFLAIKEYFIRYEQESGIHIPDQEISFLTLHVASAVTNLLEYSEKKKILIICGEGIAISQQIKTTVEHSFSSVVCDVIAIRQLESIKLENFDLVISTVPLQKVPTEYLKVGGILTTNELESIANILRIKYQKKDNIEKLEQIFDEIDKWKITQNDEYLQMNIIKILMDGDTLLHSKKTVPIHDVSIPYYYDIFSEKINLGKAISKSSQVLLENGHITSAYPQKIIQNIRDFGCYMTIAPGVLFAHAGELDGVVSDGVSIVKLEHPIEVQNPFHLPVNIILIVALKEDATQIQEVKRMISMFSSDNFLEKLPQLHTVVELEKYIEKLN